LGTCGEQGEVFLWDLAKTKEPLKRFEVGSLIAYDLEWSQNEEYFFVTTFGSRLWAYNAKTYAAVAHHDVTEHQPDSKCESVAANFKLIDKRLFCGTHRGHIAWY
jgi:WD40 repeat protein